jgi:hypothetical protein
MQTKKKKIGRNDPCPCGSGIKYKKCCLRKESSGGVLDTDSNYPEEVVIKDLLVLPKFSLFYKEKRDKIINEIHWVRDPSLPRGIDYRRTTEEHNGKCVDFIRLRRVPAVPEDEMKIAHELTHFLVEEEGFEAVCYTDMRYESVASALSSIFSDILVNRKLKVYGFDLDEGYKEELRDTYSQLKKESKSPRAPLDRLRWALNYIDDILARDSLGEGARREAQEFISWFAKRYPDIALEGDELLALIRRIGFDTPEKVKAIYRAIIEKYRLDMYGMFVP